MTADTLIVNNAALGTVHLLFSNSLSRHRQFVVTFTPSLFSRTVSLRWIKAADVHTTGVASLVTRWSPVSSELFFFETSMHNLYECCVNVILLLVMFPFELWRNLSSWLSVQLFLPGRLSCPCAAHSAGSVTQQHQTWAHSPLNMSDHGLFLLNSV